MAVRILEKVSGCIKIVQKGQTDNKDPLGLFLSLRRFDTTSLKGYGRINSHIDWRYMKYHLIN